MNIWEKLIIGSLACVLTLSLAMMVLMFTQIMLAMVAR